MRSKNGFTLIELLVVIAIIAILASVLFPVFAKAREKARQGTCASNLKQIGTATQMYVQDYDEYFPASYPGGTLGTGRYWFDLIRPYTGVPFNSTNPRHPLSSIYYCPSHMNRSAEYTSYIYVTGNSGEPRDSIRYPLIQRPSETGVITEGWSCVSARAYVIPDVATGTNAQKTLRLRHNDGANVLYYDGHVKFLSIPTPDTFKIN
ncbi:MAG TPA: hypothetical protein DCL60_09935 [Armatimonadetes bacterium]|nr:hypothetical protein [Armatimonadota bacterium]